MKDNIEDFIAAIGALAESVALFKQELERCGFGKDETLSLCNTYLQTVLIKASGGQNE